MAASAQPLPADSTGISPSVSCKRPCDWSEVFYDEFEERACSSALSMEQLEREIKARDEYQREKYLHSPLCRLRASPITRGTADSTALDEKRFSCGMRYAAQVVSVKMAPWTGNEDGCSDSCGESASQQLTGELRIIDTGEVFPFEQRRITWEHGWTEKWEFLSYGCWLLAGKGEDNERKDQGEKWRMYRLADGPASAGESSSLEEEGQGLAWDIQVGDVLFAEKDRLRPGRLKNISCGTEAWDYLYRRLWRFATSSGELFTFRDFNASADSFWSHFRQLRRLCHAFCRDINASGDPRLGGEKFHSKSTRDERGEDICLQIWRRSTEQPEAELEPRSAPPVQGGDTPVSPSQSSRTATQLPSLPASSQAAERPGGSSRKERSRAAAHDPSRSGFLRKSDTEGERSFQQSQRNLYDRFATRLHQNENYERDRLHDYFQATAKVWTDDLDARLQTLADSNKFRNMHALMDWRPDASTATEKEGSSAAQSQRCQCRMEPGKAEDHVGAACWGAYQFSRMVRNVTFHIGEWWDREDISGDKDGKETGARSWNKRDAQWELMQWVASEDPEDLGIHVRLEKDLNKFHCTHDAGLYKTREWPADHCWLPRNVVAVRKENQWRPEEWVKINNVSLQNLAFLFVLRTFPEQCAAAEDVARDDLLWKEVGEVGPGYRSTVGGRILEQLPRGIELARPAAGFVLQLQIEKLWFQLLKVEKSSSDALRGKVLRSLAAKKMSTQLEFLEEKWKMWGEMQGHEYEEVQNFLKREQAACAEKLRAAEG
eukprot:g10829.t1